MQEHVKLAQLDRLILLALKSLSTRLSQSKKQSREIRFTDVFDVVVNWNISS